MTDAVETAELAGQESAEQAHQAATDSTEQAAVTPEQPEERQEPRQQPPAWAQKRIDQVTREKYEARREAEQARTEAETYRRLLEAQQNGEQVQLPQTQQRPAEDPMQIAQQLVRQERFNEACNKVFEQGKAEFGDFEDSLKNLTYLGQIPQEFLAAVVELEKPHAVLHALASDLDAAARILALPPVQQGRELERLALKAAAPKPQPVSKAPAPVTPVDGSANAAPDPDGMSMSDWVKWREQQRKRT